MNLSIQLASWADSGHEAFIITIDTIPGHASNRGIL